MNKEKYKLIGYWFSSIIFSFPVSVFMIRVDRQSWVKDLIVILFAGIYWNLFLYLGYYMDYPWFKVSIYYLISNCILGIFSSYLFSKYGNNPIYKKNDLEKTTFKKIGYGFFWGAIIGSSISTFSYLIIQNILDPFLSHIILIKFSTTLFIVQVFQHIITGSLLGGILGSIYLRNKIDSSKHIVLFSIHYFLLVFIFTLSKSLIISLPKFWNLMNENIQIKSYSVEIFYYDLFYFILSGILLFKINIQNQFFLRSKIIKIIAISLSLAIHVSIIFGLKYQHMLLWGRFSEISQNYALAKELYTKALISNPSKPIQSYLQYRLAIIHYKEGDFEYAKKAFRNVVVQFDRHDQLVEKSSYFLNKMEQNNNSLKPILLKQWNIKTALKNSYCAPNSLAYVTQYWDIPIDARKIGALLTKLEQGTTLNQIIVFLEELLLKHFTLQLANKEDILSALNQKIPVLAYIPGHVFVIYGYDYYLDALYAYDVAQADYWVEYPWGDFYKEWEKMGKMIGLVYPYSQANKIEESLGLNTKSNDALNIRIFLGDNQNENIIRTSYLLNKAIELDPDNIFNYVDLATRSTLMHQRKYILDHINNDNLESMIYQYWNQKIVFNPYMDPYLLEFMYWISFDDEKFIHILNVSDEMGYSNWLLHYYHTLYSVNHSKFTHASIQNKKFIQSANSKKVLDIKNSSDYLNVFVNAQFIQFWIETELQNFKISMQYLYEYLNRNYNNMIADEISLKTILKGISESDFYEQYNALLELLKKYPFDLAINNKMIDLIQSKLNYATNDDQKLILELEHLLQRLVGKTSFLKYIYETEIQ